MMNNRKDQVFNFKKYKKKNKIEELYILEIYKVRDIQASSYIELPGKYKDSKSIINIKNTDQFCF